MTPKQINNIFFVRSKLYGPNLLGHRTQISIIAGNAIPNADKQRAPKREMNSPSLGIAIANITATKKLSTCQ